MRYLLAISLLLSLLIVSSVSVLAQDGAVYLDHVDGLNPDGTIPVNQTVTFNFRFENNSPLSVKSLAAGFVFSSPNGATWQPLTCSLSGGIDTLFDQHFVAERDNDGQGIDSVTLIAIEMVMDHGLPDAYNEIAFKVSTSLDENQVGKTICFDANTPATVYQWWIWDADPLVQAPPSWDGPHCFQVEVPDSPPSFTNCPDTIKAWEESPVSYDFDAPDLEDEPIRYYLVSGPGEIDSLTGVYTTNPVIGDLGQYPVTVCATDSWHICPTGNDCTFVLDVDSALAHISVSPDGFGFSALQNDALPTGQVLTITNTAYRTLNWHIEEDIPWLEPDVLQGQSNEAQITLNINTTALLPDIYEGELAIVADNADNSPQMVSISYAILRSVDFSIVDQYVTGVSQSWGPDYIEQYPQSNAKYLGAIVTNDGPITAHDVVVRFYVNGDSVGDAVIDTLGSGQSRLADVAFDIPSGGLSDAAIRVVVDPENAFWEMSESNNASTVNASLYYSATADQGFDLRRDAYGQFSNWWAYQTGIESVWDQFLASQPGYTSSYGYLKTLWLICSNRCGHGFGMASSSIDYSLNPSHKPDGYDMTTFEMPSETPVLDGVRGAQAREFSNMLDLYLGRGREFDTSAELTRFESHLKSSATPQILISESENGLRTVVATGLLELDQGRWVIPAYDVDQLLGPSSDQHIDDICLVYDENTSQTVWCNIHLDLEYWQNHPEEFPMGFPYRGAEPAGTFRLIDIADDWPSSTELFTGLQTQVAQNAWTDRRIWLFLQSPVQALITDTLDHRVGFVNNEIVNEIPDAVADTAYGVEVYQIPSDGSYSTIIEGTSNGYLHLTLFFPSTGVGGRFMIYDSMAVTQDWKATLQFTGGDTAVVVQIDSDGDGTFELQQTPDTVVSVGLNCCGLYTGGYTGNTDCDTQGKMNLADITKLIDRIYLSKNALCCDDNGYVDGGIDGKLNLSDITKLIDHVYLSRQLTAPCP